MGFMEIFFIDDLEVVWQYRSMDQQTSPNNTLAQQIGSPAASAVAWSMESERMVICAALTESRGAVMREIAGQLLSTDFFEDAHQSIWRCRSSLADAGVAHDVTAVLDTAKKLGLFVGGAEYVMELLRDDALGTNSDLAVRAAAKRIKDFSILRTFTGTLETATALAKSGSQTHEDVISYVSDSLENIRSANQLRNSGPLHVMHYVAAVTEQVEMRMSGEEPQNCVTSGFGSIDHLITGFQEGDLIILAARPSMGKTAISLAFAEAAAAGARNVLYFSTEQGGNALTYRMIASASRIDATNLRRAQLADGEWDRLFEGAQKVGNMSIYIDETSEITLPEIRARSRIFAQKHEKPIIFIDYMQRIAAHVKADPRLVIAEISTGLKNLAKELKAPVVCLAQLNRELEKRANKRPMMSDLAESGKIEQDADVIMFLYRDEVYNTDTKEPGITEVIIGKNRDGAVGIAKLSFDKRTLHYDDMTYHGH